MESYGWKTEEITFGEIGKDGQLVVIKRSGEPVGYYFDESVWERRDVEATNLDGVTKIAYGYGHPKSPDFFQIDDRAEIAVWIAAYRNHTEIERRFGCFMPTSESSGFERKREEFQFGGGCLCSLALRFYAGDKEVLALKGHIQNHPEIDSGARNLVLHELAKAKLPKSDAPESDKAEPPTVDPFAGTPEEKPIDVGKD